MLLLPEAAMRNMRRVASSGFVDTCLRLVYTAGTGDYGHGAPSYAEGDALACLFKPRPEPDALDTEVLMVDADLYLPRTTTLAPDDRVTITKLHGDAVATPQTFAIVGGPVLGKSLQHAELALVTDGSD